VAPASAGCSGRRARSYEAIIPTNHHGFNPVLARPKSGGMPDLTGETPVPPFLKHALRYPSPTWGVFAAGSGHYRFVVLE